MNKTVPLPLLFLLLTPLASGCGGGGAAKGEVSGKVFLNGEIVSYGLVSAYSDNAEMLASATIIEGEYAFTDIPIGSVTLVVQTVGPNGELMGVPSLPPLPKDGAPLPPAAKKEMMKDLPEISRKAMEKLKLVPLKYTTSTGSDIKMSVEEGKQTHDIHMKGKGERPKRIPGPPSR